MTTGRMDIGGGAGDRPHAVVVGAGFGGLEAAKQLGQLSLDVTVVDRRNYHLFQPLLYQVATGGLNPGDIAEPVRAILRERNVQVILGDVVGIDMDGQHVAIDDGRTIPFDYLVLAAGVRSGYFGHPEWEPHAPGLKTIEDAVEIRRRVLAAFERADRTPDPEDRLQDLTFVVVGGGATGVELAGAIGEIANRSMARKIFRSFDTASAKVLLIDAGSRVLPSFHPSLSKDALDQLRSLGVTVMLDTMVTGIDDSGVDVVSDGIEQRIGASTVIWAAGVEGPSLSTQTGADLDRAGRVLVQPDLSVAGHPEVFVIGDMAHIEQDGAMVPGVAPAAIQGGQHVAAAIRADLGGTARPPFRYVDKGSLATIGHSAAVMEIGRFRASGFVAWVAWWALHIALIVGFRSRVLVMFGWGWSWLTRRRGVGIITREWTPRVDGDEAA